MPLPYDTTIRKDVVRKKRKLGKTYGNVPERQARQFMHVVNSVLNRTGDKSRAYASAHAVLQRQGLVNMNKQECIDTSYLVQLIAESIVESTSIGSYRGTIEIVKSTDGNSGQMVRYVTINGKKFPVYNVTSSNAILMFLDGQVIGQSGPKGSLKSLVDEFVKRYGKNGAKNIERFVITFSDGDSWQAMRVVRG